MKRQSGFTIIELVVVIALLGILSAVALPRFIDVTQDARRAAVSGAAGGLGAGVALVRAQSVVDNVAAGNTVAIDGLNIIANGRGYPVGTNGTAITDGSGDQTLNAADCVAIWGAVLQGSAPTVAASGTATDYVASASGSVCTYAYQVGRSATETRDITYDSNNGDVSIATTEP
ncbi:type II secretion system protein [Neptunomonas marina]|uniref:Type II secretion system protein n=1 Tax=Neptunomonas marina TaxID=1815562 RepID=A0A437Q598_9GAMM|nr:type II secretion system protein [Neptunomonas marina]RVU29673.1 type II secretion system protein [Neptunomonas marina]